MVSAVPSSASGHSRGPWLQRLAAGSITRVRVIGQGTAAVAGQSMAAILDELCGGVLDVDATTATELSGFGLRLDMSDTVVVAISQSGTTTDTNRTVDLLRARGAAVLAIVNRRSSDLTEKADGVLYTSDGRDVEMSVASTKAFYAQVAAGVLLACAISEAAGLGDDRRRHALLTSLLDLPDAMREVLARRTVIADAARRYAPSKRYWAVVGSGSNKVAAEEVRIKLSELCYKSIACDVTEDKKHIDLSAEPLILVCAAGLAGSTADDVGKEVAIFRAHKATPIVIADDGDARYPAAAVIGVPPVDPALGFVLSAMAGHLFGYEAALAIDALARPLRQAREVIERAVAIEPSADAVLVRVKEDIRRPADHYVDDLRSQRYDGHLEASTAVRLAGLLRDVASARPVEEYQAGSGKVGSPAALVDDLVMALTRAIEELTRPIDAIKHQAKTVTVGISRSDEGVIDRPLVRAVLDAGAGRDVLSYRTLKVLAALDPAVAEITGFTRYGIEGAMLTIVDRGGISNNIASRVDRTPVLVGTKRRVASEREVLVSRGRRDGRTVILVPEVKADADDGDHAAARPVPRPPRRSDDALGARRVRPPLRPTGRLGDGDRGVLRRSTARRAAGRRAAHRSDLRRRGPLAGMMFRFATRGCSASSQSRPAAGAQLAGDRPDKPDRSRAGLRRSLRPPHPPPGGLVKGIGLDVVEIERFRTSLTRTPSMRERLFTAVELEYADRKADPVPSLAARFAAREAVMKALGLGLGAFGFHDVWVEVEESGQPRLHVTARARELAVDRGVTRWHLSISHDGPVAVAIVAAE